MCQKKGNLITKSRVQIASAIGVPYDKNTFIITMPKAF